MIMVGTKSQNNGFEIHVKILSLGTNKHTPLNTLILHYLYHLSSSNFFSSTTLLIYLFPLLIIIHFSFLSPINFTSITYYYYLSIYLHINYHLFISSLTTLSHTIIASPSLCYNVPFLVLPLATSPTPPSFSNSLQSTPLHHLVFFHPDKSQLPSE